MSDNSTEPMGLETPEDDAAEQHTPLRRDDETEWTIRLPLDADEADAAEQGRPVELDEDDYR
jgi:hypothetical protein